MSAGETTRVWKASRKSIAGIELTEDSAAIFGDKNHFMLANPKGLFMKGPISFIAGGEEIRTGGLFVHGNDFIRMIPSTIITPFPAVLPIPPAFEIPNIKKDIAFFIGLMV